MIFQVGDRVVYQRADGERQERNGQEGVIIKINSDGYILIKFTTQGRTGKYTHNADPDNVQPAPLDPQHAIMLTIRRLEKRQHFYRYIGKDLPAWKSLESV